MTSRIENVVLLERESAQQCDGCGKVAELRPYGPNGECICFECCAKNPQMEAAAKKRFAKLLSGDWSDPRPLRGAR